MVFPAVAKVLQRLTTNKSTHHITYIDIYQHQSSQSILQHRSGHIVLIKKRRSERAYGVYGLVLYTRNIAEPLMYT